MLLLGDCVDKLKDLSDNSIDSVVTDPPYGLKFMGKKWDYDVPNLKVWQECLRVLKPGGYLLSFAGTRTYHRMAVRIEDAGFEIRDMIAYVYGSGFPKSLNIGKKLKDWEGWGTALKPALEPICVARKPFKGTVAQNVLKWGTGGINIDGSRVGTEEKLGRPQASGSEINPFSRGLKSNGFNDYSDTVGGRFPANFIHDGSEEVERLFPERKGFGGGGGPTRFANAKGGKKLNTYQYYKDSGSASRFFYCAKASKSERNKGLEGFEEKQTTDGRKKDIDNAFQRGKTLRNNNHPTVKPIKLMQYLVKLVTPPQGKVLDPFMGSGTTGIACKLEGFEFIGIEMEEEYLKIAEARIKAHIASPKLF